MERGVNSFDGIRYWYDDCSIHYISDDCHNSNFRDSDSNLAYTYLLEKEEDLIEKRYNKKALLM